MFPSLYIISNCHNLPISFFVSFHNPSAALSWNLHFRRSLRDEEINQLSTFLGILERVTLVEGVDDFRVWEGDPSGMYSVKSMFQSFFQSNINSLNFSFFNFIWNTPIPTKIQILSWTTTLGKLPTAEVIQKRWPNCALSPNWCVLCRKEAETQDHLLVHCNFSYALWVRALQELRLVWVIPKTAKDLFDTDLGQLLGKKGKIFWRMVVHGICWAIWLERNRRIFQDTQGTNEDCWEIIKINIANWIRSVKEFQGLAISDLTRDWSYIYWTEKEMNRRKDMAANLRSKINQMASTLNMSNFAIRDSLLGPEIKPVDAMTRATGLDNYGVVGLQRQIMKEQDEGLEKLEETVISTKHIALAVNEELDLHTRLIDNLDEHVEITDSRLQRAQKMLSRLNKRTKGGCSCFNLFLSVIGIVVLVVVIYLLVKYL